jgi:hypothetical protein
MPTELIIPLLVVVAVGLLGFGLMPVSQPRLRDFVLLTGVDLTERNAPFIVDGIARTRRWRIAVALMLVSILSAVEIVYDQLSISTLTGVVAAGGILLGTVIGEVRSVTRRGDGPRSASLEVRRESDYVGSWARVTLGWLALTGVVLGVAGILVTGDAVGVGVASSLAMLPALVDRWVTRVILERPRPSDTSADVVAADDGLRSRALHGIGAAGVLSAVWSVVALAAALLVGAPTRSAVDSVPSHVPISWPLALLLLAILGAGAWKAWTLAQQTFLVQMIPVPPVDPETEQQVPAGAADVEEGAGA